MRRIGWLAIVGLLASSCAHPLPIHRQEWVLGQVAERYHQFFADAHDPDPKRDVGLLRPRFGLPAIAQAGSTFDVELLERGGPEPLRAALVAQNVDDAQAAACANGAHVEGCWPLALGDATRTEVARDVTHAAMLARADAPPGAYDLYLESPVDAPVRLPRVVWLRADDPAKLQQVRVAHLSDMHVGKHRKDLEAHIKQVIDDVNALKPDLVLVTGDIVNWGADETLPPRARELLLSVDAPVVTVIGNHDIGFDRDAFWAEHYGEGWANFARWFHPFLYFSFNLGGFDFLGFDSGASGFSPRVLTRGLEAETVDSLRDAVADDEKAGRRGTILFSHAPSRAALLASANPAARGLFGQMQAGKVAFETVLLDAAQRGYRVLHLAGHTHWSDVFEAEPGAKNGALRFIRWAHNRLVEEPAQIMGRACLITTQSCSHPGLSSKDNARGWGFAFLVLGDGPPEISFHRYGLTPPPAHP